MADKIDKKISATVDSIVRPKKSGRRSKETPDDHRTRLTERRIRRLVRGAERRNARHRG